MDLLKLPNKNENNKLPFDINNYIHQKYEDKKKIWMQNYAGQELQDMLQKYCDQLNKKMDFYNDRISRWCNKLNKDYEDGKKSCTIEIPLYGPDVYYDSDERELLNRALNNLLWTLGSKGYSYTCKEREEKHNDCMDGSCLIGTRVLTVQY